MPTPALVAALTSIAAPALAEIAEQLDTASLLAADAISQFVDLCGGGPLDRDDNPMPAQLLAAVRVLRDEAEHLQKVRSAILSFDR